MRRLAIAILLSVICVSVFAQPPKREESIIVDITKVKKVKKNNTYQPHAFGIEMSVGGGMNDRYRQTGNFLQYGGSYYDGIDFYTDPNGNDQYYNYNWWTNYEHQGKRFGFGLDVSCRYTWHPIPYVGWDVFKFKFSIADNFEQMGFAHALSGVRFSTPRFGKSKVSYVYTAFRFGVSFYNDTEYIKKNFRQTLYSRENMGTVWNPSWQYISYDFDFDYFERKWSNKLSFSWECDIIGIHFRHFFMNTKYSNLNGKHYFGFGLGIDIGRVKEIVKKIVISD